MLIEKKNLSAGDIVVLKPLTGDGEIIGRLKEDYTDASEIKVMRPLVGHMVQQENGVGMAFLPFSLAARDDQVFSFDISRLTVAPYMARDEIKTSYISQTSSLTL